MRDFDEFMRDNFDAHLGVVTVAGGVPRKRARSVVQAIRRRRATRAGTAAGVTVLAVGALAVGAVTFGARTEAPSHGFPTPPPGSPSWCDLNTYPRVNPDALGASNYEGRVYRSPLDGTYVYVTPDGARHVLEPGAHGAVTARPPGGYYSFDVASDLKDLNGVALDLYRDGSGEAYADGVHDPRLLYEWTTTVPAVVPEGVDAAELSQLLGSALGFGGTGFRSSAVPNGAAVETIYRWNDGHERKVTVLPNSFGGMLKDYTGIASVSVWVSGLPDGGTFEITSTYDPTKTWSAACRSGLPTPSLTYPVVVAGPYLEGPEYGVFRCLAPIPADAEDAIETTIEVKTGVQPIPDSDTLIDLGPRGILVTSAEEIFDIAPGAVAPAAPGWSPDWGGIDGVASMHGAVVFTALAWVGADNVVVGREVSTPDPDGLLNIGDRSGLWGGGGSQHQFSYVAGYVDSLGVPCPGADPGALDTASLVWLEGYGPDADEMTWSWTRISPPPAS